MLYVHFISSLPVILWSAMQLYPGADLRLKKHHGRAEALLLAAYGLR